MNTNATRIFVIKQPLLLLPKNLLFSDASRGMKRRLIGLSHRSKYPSLPTTTQAANWVTCFLTNGGKYLSTHSEHVTTQFQFYGMSLAGSDRPLKKCIFCWCISSKIFLFFGHFYFRRKRKQRAVPNITTGFPKNLSILVDSSFHPTGSSDRFNYKCSAECTA